MVFRGAYGENPTADTETMLLFMNNGETNADVGDLTEQEGLWDWKYAVNPDYYRYGGNVGIGLQYKFGLDMQRYHQKQIGLIDCALGGAAISRYQKGGDLYERAVKRVQKAKKDGVVIKGIIWHQGETNSTGKTTEVAQDYANILNLLLDNFKTDIIEPDLPVVVGELGRFLESNATYPDYETINVQINTCISKIPNCKVASSEGLILSLIHI